MTNIRKQIIDMCARALKQRKEGEVCTLRMIIKDSKLGPPSGEPDQDKEFEFDENADVEGMAGMIANIVAGSPYRFRFEVGIVPSRTPANDQRDLHDWADAIEAAGNGLTRIEPGGEPLWMHEHILVIESGVHACMRDARLGCIMLFIVPESALDAIGIQLHKAFTPEGDRVDDAVFQRLRRRIAAAASMVMPVRSPDSNIMN